MSALRVGPLLLLTLPLLNCESVAPTESPSPPSLHSQRGGDESLSDAALIVGNFIPAMMGAIPSGNGILRYNGRGEFIDVFVDLTLPNGPRGGCCMTFGPDENLYVTAGGGMLMPGRVNRFNGVTGAFIDAFVTPGSGGLGRPLVPVFGPDGNLYVGDFGSHSIRRYNGRTGAFIDEFVAAGQLGTGAADPQLFVFGPDGNLYVALPGSNVVRRFDGRSGTLINDFVIGTADRPVGPSLTFGPVGDLYVTSGNGVNRYDGETGAFIEVFVSQGSGGLSVPVGLRFGPDENLYVASATTTGDGSVLRYDGETGAFIDAFVPSTEPHITAPRLIEFKSKIKMCHRSRENRDTWWTISIGYLSASEHVAHGDAVGPCPE
jgi:hypothetical protein